MKPTKQTSANCSFRGRLLQAKTTVSEPSHQNKFNQSYNDGRGGTSSMVGCIITDCLIAFENANKSGGVREVIRLS